MSMKAGDGLGQAIHLHTFQLKSHRLALFSGQKCWRSMTPAPGRNGVAKGGQPLRGEPAARVHQEDASLHARPETAVGAGLSSPGSIRGLSSGTMGLPT